MHNDFPGHKSGANTAIRANGQGMFVQVDAAFGFSIEIEIF